MTTPVAVRVEVVPDEDGVCAVKHMLGVEDVVVTVETVLDPPAVVGIYSPIDENECEVVLTTDMPVTLFVVARPPD